MKHLIRSFFVMVCLVVGCGPTEPTSPSEPKVSIVGDGYEVDVTGWYRAYVLPLGGVKVYIDQKLQEGDLVDYFSHKVFPFPVRGGNKPVVFTNPRR